MLKNRLHKLFKLNDTGWPLLFLAPMAGYTNAPMRRICHAHGAALCYTEMTSDLGLLHDSEKTWPLLETFNDEGPIIAHLYGVEPASLAEAAARVEKTGRFTAIDLNAGCPVHKITANGAGAALINDPQRIHDILAAMRKQIRLPLTIKTRLGPHPEKIAIFEILEAAQSAGADAFALHGRFTSQGHGGSVHLDLLADVKQRAKIPIIGNGGIRSSHDAWRMFHETGVDAIMIARGAIGNPWIFEDICDDLTSSTIPPLQENQTAGRTRRNLEIIVNELESHLAYELKHLQLIRDRYEVPAHAKNLEFALVTTFRCHLFRYLHGLKGSSFLRGHLHELHTLEDIRTAIKSCLEREQAYRDACPHHFKNITKT